MTVWGDFGRVVVAVALLLVTACNGGDDSEPRALPSLTGSAEATPSPTASMTVEQEVEAAVRAYYEAFNVALATGDVEQLRAKSLPTCNCRQLADFVETKTRQGRVEGSQATIGEIKPHDIQGTSGAATVTVQFAAARFLDRRGAPVSTARAASAIEDMIFVRSPGTGEWLVSRVVGLDGSR